jgi:hypothetical protein
MFRNFAAAISFFADAFSKVAGWNRFPAALVSIPRGSVLCPQRQETFPAAPKPISATIVRRGGRSATPLGLHHRIHRLNGGAGF